MGEWMRRHGRSVYRCTQSDFVPPPDCRTTQNGKRLYLHLFAYPYLHVHLKGLAERVDYAQFLHDASEVKRLGFDPHAADVFTSADSFADALTLELPVLKPDVTVPVVELFLKKPRPVRTGPSRHRLWRSPNHPNRDTVVR